MTAFSNKMNQVSAHGDTFRVQGVGATASQASESASKKGLVFYAKETDNVAIIVGSKQENDMMANR